MELNVSSEDFGSMCVSAIRYCRGRRTYMPSIVIGVVLANVKTLTDRDLGVLLSDCEYQRRMESYGDAKIDKPLWLKYEFALKSEKERRASE